MAAYNGNFVTWPVINELNFKKFLGTIIPIEKGYMDQEYEILRSAATDEKLDLPPSNYNQSI